MTPAQEARRFVTTGEHDALHGAWPGGNFLEKTRTAEHTLRAALIKEVRQRTKDRAAPPLPAGFDASQLVLRKVGPMVTGFFPAREQQVVLDLFKKSLVFVTHDNVEQLVSETRWLSTSWKVATLYLGSIGLLGLDKRPVGFVGFSEETTFYVSTKYFQDGNPFADWVVHEAAHVFHNWKRERASLPHTHKREFLLELAFAKREVFAYACEAYARILERAKGPAERRRLHAEYAENGVPDCDGVDRTELVDIMAAAGKARNGWKRILERCSPPRRSHTSAGAVVR